MRRGTRGDHGPWTMDYGLWTKRLKRILFLVLGPWSLVLPCGPAWAQDLDPTLSVIEQTYQSTQTLKADFVQSTVVHLLEKTITRPGRIFYEKGGKLRIEYAGDKMTHYVINGDTLWLIDPELKDVKIYSLKDSGVPEEALNFLNQLGDLRQYFNVTPDKKNKLVLKPKGNASYKALYCTFNKNHLLEYLTIQNRTGNTTDYRFFNIKTGIPLPARLFQP